MKYIKSYLFLVLTAALALTGCKQDDLQDDVDALANRVAILEEQVKLLNENLETISFVLNSENKTIQSVTQSGNAYTLTLSNGETLTLNIGVQGSIDVPEIPEDAEYNSLISISEDGYWVIRGEKTGHKAVGQPGANGSGYPEFRVNDGKWQVRFLSDDGEVTENWADVEGTANASIGEIGDQLIAGVDTSDPTRLTITYYTNYSEGTTEEVSLPIVPGLICQIVTEDLLDDDGYLQMEAGTIQTLSVKISGGTPQLTYPSGWRATIEDPESDGVYELTIYSPAEDAATASAQSRVSANNTEDVTVRVQSGMYWAVDKVKVKIGSDEPVEPTYSSVYEKYQAEGITIGSYTLNSESGMNVTEVTSDQTISDAPSGAYFINEGVTVTFSNVNIKDNLILISNSIDGGKAKVTVNNTFNAATGGIETNLIAQNIEFTREGLFMQLAAGRKIENLILDGCKVTMGNSNNLFNGHQGDDDAIENIEICNSDIHFNQDKGGGGRILNFAPNTGSTDNNVVSANITFKNNIIYGNQTFSINGALLTTTLNNDYPGSYKGSLLVENNTFVNYAPANGLVRSKMDNAATIKIANCLFWDGVSSSTVRMVNLEISSDIGLPASLAFENIKCYSSTASYQYLTRVPSSGYDQYQGGGIR